MQIKIVGRFLTKEDLKDFKVNEQFKEIMASYYALIEAGNEQVDLVGRGGILKKCMSNIFITPEKQLYIIDTTLLEFRGSGIFYPIFLLVLKLAVWRNNSLIKFFNESFQ